MIEIGKPFNPSTIVKWKEIKMSEIMISCGGGVGGSLWEVYTRNKFDLNDKFITIDTNEDKNLVVNTNFIVQVRPVKVVNVTIKNDGNSNVKQPIGTTKDYYYLIPQGESVIVVNKYFSDRDNPKRIYFNK